MSSLKHVVARRVHLERQPPPGRPKAVERRKDFKKRAQQTKERGKLLKILADKARDRNPEEFNFKMLKSRMVNGNFTRIKPDLNLTNAQKQILKNNQIAQETRLRKTQEQLLQGQVLDLARQAERTHIFYLHQDEETVEEQTVIDQPDTNSSAAPNTSISPDEQATDHEEPANSLSFLQ